MPPKWLRDNLSFFKEPVPLPDPVPITPIEMEPIPSGPTPWEEGMPKFCEACGKDLVARRVSKFDKFTGEEYVHLVVLMCMERVYNPKTAIDHTSMQWDRRSWYGSDNLSFLELFKQPSAPYTSVGSFTTYTSATNIGFGHSTIKG